MHASSTKSRLINWLVSFAIPTGVFCLIFFLVRKYTYAGASNALFGAGGSLLGILGIILINRQGVFDILGYSFRRLFESFKVGNPKSFEDAYEYGEYRKNKRAESPMFYLPYLVSGIIFLLMALAFCIVDASLPH